MTCCVGPIAADTARNPDALKRELRRAELSHFAKQVPQGAQYVLSVPQVHCGACISTIEHDLLSKSGVKLARVNLSMRRLTVILDSTTDVVDVLDRLAALGFSATAIDLGDHSDLDQKRPMAELMQAMGVAGFAAANIMLLSVSIWAGADGDTRNLFHLVSALIAVPTVAFSGRVFFRSALGALSAHRLNMDVPISLAILLALGMSSFEAVTGGAETYFDAAVTLLFFLLVGRTLDMQMREKARHSIRSLAHLGAKSAALVSAKNKITHIAIDEVKDGDIIRIFAGNRFPVDGVIISGASEVDRSLVTGESDLILAKTDDYIEAGTLNVSGSIDLRAAGGADVSFLSEVIKMLAAAEQGRGKYIRIADRMATIYAPAVHLLALFAFIGWMIFTQGNWHASLYVAISVLIITCPCALGLAVPVVHVIGAARLFKQGVMMRDGSALERLAEIDTVVFDKTGTLTNGAPQLREISGNITQADTSLMAAMAARTSHPVAQALSAALADHLLRDTSQTLNLLKEIPGMGIEITQQGKTVRLGKPEWVAEINARQVDRSANVCFAVEGGAAANIFLAETQRQDAGRAIDALRTRGFSIEISSGDREKPVSKLANELGVSVARYDQSPKDKFDRLNDLRQSGSRALMVGDGINDAPGLAACHVSMAPSSAADVGRSAADFVFCRESLLAVPFAYDVATAAGRIVKQNFAIALAYNCISVPLAMAGYVTPLVAALAMSTSSIVVISNSLRLNMMKFDSAPNTPASRPAIFHKITKKAHA